MKNILLLCLFFLPLGVLGADVLQVKDNIGLAFIKSETDLIKTMRETEKLRKGLVLRILEAVDGPQKGQTTTAHEKAVNHVVNLFPDLKSYQIALNDFYKTLTLDKVYELKYTPAHDDYEAAQNYLRQMFFLSACYDINYENLSDTDKAKENKEADKNNIILWRQEYLSDIGLVSLDFANEIYNAVQNDASTFPTQEGGVCLKEDLQLTIQYYQRLCQKLAVDIALQMRMLELQAAFLLQDLPVQEQLPPIYRQSEAERLKRIKDPAFSMQKYLKEKWCKEGKTWE